MQTRNKGERQSDVSPFWEQTLSCVHWPNIHSCLPTDGKVEGMACGYARLNRSLPPSRCCMSRAWLSHPDGSPGPRLRIYYVEHDWMVRHIPRLHKTLDHHLNGTSRQLIEWMCIEGAGGASPPADQGNGHEIPSDGTVPCSSLPAPPTLYEILYRILIPLPLPISTPFTWTCC